MEGSEDTSASVGRIPEVGDVVEGRYRLEEVIATGGMGVIMRARQLAMERDVAVKLLHPHMTSDPETVARFEQEVHLAKLLTHPNTIQLFDFGRAEGDALYIVMEYLDGEDLRDLVRREGPLAVGRAVDIALQALDGLAAAHEKNVIHRDIKPSNIFISRHRRGGDLVKLLDFGVAKSLGAAQQDLTATGKICGTPKYMAPEAVLQDRSDKSGDVYAIGLILLEMLIGRQVFDGNGMAQLILMQLQKPAPIPERLADTPLAEVIKRACAKHPGDRYVDADAMLDALEEAKGAMPAELRLEADEVPELPTPNDQDILSQLGGQSAPGLGVLEDDSGLRSYEVVPDSRGDGMAADADPGDSPTRAREPSYPRGEGAQTPRGQDPSNLHQTPSQTSVERPDRSDAGDAEADYRPTEKTEVVQVGEPASAPPGPDAYKPTERNETPFETSGPSSEPPPAGRPAREPGGGPGAAPTADVSSRADTTPRPDGGFEAVPEQEARQVAEASNGRGAPNANDGGSRGKLWAGLAGVGLLAAAGAAVFLWNGTEEKAIEIGREDTATEASGAPDEPNIGPAIALSSSIVRKSAARAHRYAARQAEETGGANRVTLRSDPPGATVYRHGESRGTTPVTLRVGSDRRVEVQLRKPGFVDTDVVLDGRQGSTLRVPLEAADEDGSPSRVAPERPTAGAEEPSDRGPPPPSTDRNAEPSGSASPREADDPTPQPASGRAGGGSDAPSAADETEAAASAADESETANAPSQDGESENSDDAIESILEQTNIDE